MFRDIYSVSYRMKRELYHRVFLILLSVFVCFASINLIRLALFYPVLSKSDSMSPGITYSFPDILLTHHILFVEDILFLKNLLTLSAAFLRSSSILLLLKTNCRRLSGALSVFREIRFIFQTILST